MPPTRPALRLFSRGSWAETRRISAILSEETVGGALLVAATVLAIAWANSPWSAAYERLRGLRAGPAAAHLDLSLGAWAADGLLAVFFFVAGLELKREFVAGDLRDPRRAVLPVAAAVGGMAVPALIFVLINLGNPGALKGWAVPTATDIAFALAVLALLSTHLPAALRTFLLTLAVVDDLLAIAVIAFCYTARLAPLPLLAVLVPLGLFGLLVQRRVTAWWLLLPLAVLVWGLVHASGVHPTVAGVLLAVTVPVDLAGRFEDRWRPLSTGVCVPVFAFLAVGVQVGGLGGLGDAFGDPVALGIVAARVAGKPLGILAAAFLLARLTRAELDERLRWADVAGLGVLAGIGLTVPLVIGGLAFGEGSQRYAHVKLAVLAASLLAAGLAALLLAARNRVYRRLCEEEAVDADADGIPDVYQREQE